MMKIFKTGLLCLCLVLPFLLSSCGSKVNQDELDKKIEAAIENDGLWDSSFTDAEYEFMAKYLLDKINEQKEPDDKEAEKIGSYVIILSLANSQGKLTGDAKKTYEEFQKKSRGILGRELMDRNLSDFSDDTISDEMEAVEVIEDYCDTDVVAVGEIY